MKVERFWYRRDGGYSVDERGYITDSDTFAAGEARVAGRQATA